jgi:predicted acyltransferase
MAGKQGDRAGKRLDSVDIFRGAAVAAFLIFNFLGSLVPPAEMPQILLHNQGDILLPGDFIAGFFAFLIGIGLSMSFEKRKGSESPASILRRNLARGAGLLLLGLLLDGIDGLALQWGVLQSLGLALLIAAMFLPLGNKPRALAAAAILLSYGYFLQTDAGFGGLLQYRHGGPIGAISYAAIAIFGMIAGNWLVREDRREIVIKLMLAGLALLAAGAVMSAAIPPNKLLVSPSYSLCVSGAASAIMALLYQVVEVGGWKSDVLRLFGMNSLLAWVLQYPLAYWPLAILDAFFSIGFAGGVAATAILVVIVYAILLFGRKSGFRLSI